MKTRIVSVAMLALLIAVGLVGATTRSASAYDDACYDAYKPIVAQGDGTTKGTSRSDVIVAYTDNNIIYAGAGNDVICSYGHNNVVYGGSGADEIYFYAPQDGSSGGTAYGESGNDYILIIDSEYFADGGSGNDTIEFYNVFEIRGGSGTDSIWGSGAYAVYANDGNDSISIEYVHLLDCGTGRDYWGYNSIDIVQHCERQQVPG